jgi:hypothetical protein
LGKRIEDLLVGQGNLLASSNMNSNIEELAHYYCVEIKKKRSHDFGGNDKDWHTVDLSTLKNKDCREMGAEWLCKQVFDQLNIAEFLHQKGWSEKSISLACTHIISRTVYPTSELRNCFKIT